jgi:hypothetical protein
MLQQAGNKKMLFTPTLSPVEHRLPSSAAGNKEPAPASQNFAAVALLLGIAAVLALSCFFLLHELGGRYLYTTLVRLGTCAFMVAFVVGAAGLIGRFSRR